EALGGLIPALPEKYAGPAAAAPLVATTLVEREDGEPPRSSITDAPTRFDGRFRTRNVSGRELTYGRATKQAWRIPCQSQLPLPKGAVGRSVIVHHAAVPSAPTDYAEPR